MQEHIVMTDKVSRMPKVLVVGSLNMDQIAVTRRCPNAGETVIGGTFSKAPGGKGANQAVQAARLGAEVTMAGRVGSDANGDEMLDALHKSGVDTSRIVRDGGAPSGCTMIILEDRADGGTENRILVLPGANMKLCRSDVEFLHDTIGSFDMVMMQHEVPQDVNEVVAEWAAKAGVPVMLNPAPSATVTDKMMKSLWCISPNEHEAADLTGIKGDAKAVARALLERGAHSVLVTLGKEGAFYTDGKDEVLCSAINEVKAVDPTAAGDSYVASFCVALAQGQTVEEAMRFASVAATLTVSRKGAMPSLPTLDEVVKFCKEHGIE